MELRRALNMCNLYVWGSRMLHKGHYVSPTSTITGKSGRFWSVVIYPDKMTDR